MSPYGGSIPRPVSDQSLNTILPRHATLRSKSDQDPSAHSSTDVTLFRIASKQETLDSTSQTYTLSGATHESLVETMRLIMNEEIERGDTYPHEFQLDEAQFEGYFFSGDAFVLLRGDYQQATEVKARVKTQDWEKDLLGFFYIKPNFPVRIMLSKHAMPCCVSARSQISDPCYSPTCPYSQLVRFTLQGRCSHVSGR